MIMTRVELLAVRESLYRAYVHSRERANALEKVFNLAKQMHLPPEALDEQAHILLEARELELTYSKAVIRLGNEATGRWP
jgi:hypothetical protein